MNQMQDGVYGMFKSKAMPNEMLFIAKVKTYNISKEEEEQNMSQQIEDFEAKVDNFERQLDQETEEKLFQLADEIFHRLGRIDENFTES